MMACEETGIETKESQDPDAPELPVWRPETALTDSSADDEYSQVVNEVADLIRAFRGDSPATPVIEYEKLDRILPRKVADLPRVSREGRTNSIGLGLSGVEAVYEGENVTVTLRIADLAPYSNLAHLLFMEWTRGEIDRETHQGYERARQFHYGAHSWPAFEKAHTQDGRTSCEFEIWVSRRFLVSIEGEGTDENVCHEARSDIAFGRLARLATSQR